MPASNHSAAPISGICFKAGEITGARLASIHNLRFLLRMMEDIRAAIAEDRLEEYRKRFLQSL